MVTLTPNQVISHQEFDPWRKRLVGILEDDKDVVYYVNFELDKASLLVARIKHRLGKPQIPEIIQLKEKHIRYLRAGASLHEAELLCDSLQRSEIIFKIAQRTVVIIDMEIDKKFYERLNNCSKSIPSLENNTYILMGPEPLQQKSKIPLKVEEPCSSPILDESEDTQGSREESVEKGEPPLLPPKSKLRISFTPEADL